MVTEALTPDGISASGTTKPLLRADGRPAVWEIASAPVPYPDALNRMQSHVRALAAGESDELIWLLEHPPLYTAGTSAKAPDLLQPEKLPVYSAGRGGQYTYHGPGQRVVYVMLDLRQRGRDVRCFVNNLEGWVIDTLAAFNIKAYRRQGRIGVWVNRPERGPDTEDKIAAIGVRVSKWVSFHGISINIDPDLKNYEGIVPCGIVDQGVTSFEDLGQLVSIEQVDTIMRQMFEERFGPTRS